MEEEKTTRQLILECHAMLTRLTERLDLVESPQWAEKRDLRDFSPNVMANMVSEELKPKNGK